MSNGKFLRKLQKSFRHLWRMSVKLVKSLINRLLASLLGRGRRRRRHGTSGFVLPTVVMVMLVVILLTTAMVLRSFDRAKNASNFRVSPAALNAGGPAIERAKAKIEALFNDPTLPRSTPSERTLYNAIVSQPGRYTFGDEIALKVIDDFGDGAGVYSEAGDGTVNSTDNGSDPSSGGATELANSETTNTAWKFPVDTDNNGKYDSFTLYGLYFRSPPISGTSTTRPRTALEARTPPMEEVSIESGCEGAIGTSAALVGSNGWYKVGSELRKSFYVYAVTVPITVEPSAIASVVEMGAEGRYEKYKGNKGFSALEMQQDIGKIPLQYHAVWYQDDLSLTPDTPFRLNGRVFTNSNLFISENCDGGQDCPIRLYLISSPASCYFNEENSKIVVGGNLVNGGASWDSSVTTYAVQVDMFNEDLAVRSDPSSHDIDTNTSQSIVSDEAPRNVAYNNQAYEERIDFLTRSAKEGSGGSYRVSGGDVTEDTRDPQVVKTRVEARLKEDSSLNPKTVRLEEIELYMRNRTRRVPFKELASGVSALGTTYDVDIDSDGLADPDPGVFEGDPFASVSAGEAVEGLRPPDAWAFPTDPIDGITGIGYTGLDLNISGPLALPRMTEPQQQEDQGYEEYLGDRILLGNNLPALWYKDSLGDFVGDDETQELSGINWNAGDGTRYRKTRVQRLDDLGTTNRNGFWERAAAEEPSQRLENKGGLRVVTGAGIYVDGLDVASGAYFPRLNAAGPRYSFLPQPTLGAGIDDASKDTDDIPTYEGLENIYVWPDTMPMWEDTNDDGVSDSPSGTHITLPGQEPVDLMGDLLMRTTVVYHYAESADGEDFKDELPIACVSSYYDLTTETTAKNYILSGDSIPASDRESWDNEKRYDGANGRSNNGIVYPPPNDALFYGSNRSEIATSLSEYYERMERQARLVYPNGRIVNEPLRTALEKIEDGEELSLADNSAIDAAMCSLRILRDSTFNPLTTAGSRAIEPGTIYEQTFLDAQQIKAIHRDDADAGATTPRDLDETFSLNNGVGDYLEDSPAYDLPIEQRQPIEIRATVLNLEKLRTTTISSAVSTGPSQEFLLPNTGIIYATRNDALPDMSASGPDDATRLALSAVDFKLDPTRRPNAIMLVDGDRLDRKYSTTVVNEYHEEEKGLILATNLPVYIQASVGLDGSTYGFNLHQTSSGAIQEEFETPLDDSWSNFYSRNNLDPDFACRNGQPGCTTSGDLWRSATIISDAVTLLSDRFRFGYRVEGDYDLRNNAGGARNSGGNDIMMIDRDGDGTIDETIDPAERGKENGFFANNYVTSRDFQDSDYRSLVIDPEPEGYQASSYFNNFVTPVQRRTNFHEYVMEICRKPMVELCTPDDWVVGTTTQPDLKASEIDLGTSEVSLLSGTTARAATNAADQRYPRRVAFLRNPSNNLILTINTSSGKARPIPIGINNNGQVQWYPYRNVRLPLTDDRLDLSASPPTLITSIGTSRPRPQPNALWYTTRASDRNYSMPDSFGSRLWYRQGEDGIPDLTSGSAMGTSGYKYTIGVANEQPLLEPVLQLQKLTGNVSTSGTANFNSIISSTKVSETRWLQQPRTSTFNIVAVAGQGPIRIDTTHDRIEFGGGLQNYMRTLENWGGIELRVNGSFIQSKQNNYATGPQRPLSHNTTDLTGSNALFTGQLQGYKTGNGGYDLDGTSGDTKLRSQPYYSPPDRRFSFDVGLMTQAPDLFAEQFTVEPASSPKEFLREVGRDDDWIKVLLCAGEASDKVGDSGATYNNFAVPDKKERPSICQNNTTGYPANPT